MLTFQDQVTMAKEISGLTDAASVTKFKRDINQGGVQFLAALGREYNRKSRVANLVAGTQLYQLPEDALRIGTVIASDGTYNQPLEQIPDETTWRYLTAFGTQGLPSHYFVRGFDEIGLYPTPSQSVTNGLEIVFEPKHTQLTEDDFTAGTTTVTAGNATITHSATGFTQNMVGRWFQVTDGTDGRWYRIATFVSTSALTLENYYQGYSGGGRSFRIGQVMDLPEEFLEGPVDYAIYRHYLRRGNRSAADFKSLYEQALQSARENYAQTTSSQIVDLQRVLRSYNPLRGDSPPSLSS